MEDHVLFMHSSVGGHWGCFHSSAVVNKMAVNVCTNIYSSAYFQSSGAYIQDWKCWVESYL